MIGLEIILGVALLTIALLCYGYNEREEENCLVNIFCNCYKNN